MMAFKAVDEFLKLQSWPNSDAKYWNIAVKFLMARKFDVDRALKLYNEHQNLRRREGLDFINLNDDEFIKDLESGKFTILPFIKNYPVYALFTVKYHSSSTDPVNELTTLKTLVYQLDAALENPDAQRNGINFIYDMNNCKRSNYDLSLSQKILTLVRGSYPARLNKLLVVSAPFWFKCVVKVLGILMREKLRERVVFVTNDELLNQVPVEILPDYLGGNAKLNHKSWLVECNRLVTNKSSTCSCYYYSSSSSSSSSSSTTSSSSKTNQQNGDLNKRSSLEPVNGVNKKRSTSELIDDKKSTKKQPSNEKIVNFGDKIEPIPFNSNFYQSIQNSDGTDVTSFNVNELVEHVIRIGSMGLSEEFKQIRLQPVVSSFDVFKDKDNMFKNRYRDVICLDVSRVKLNKQYISLDDDDYIHANYVDGYKQKNAYISTQGPLDETVKDFWHMVWQEFILVIAMTTKVIEQRKIKCAQYWPLDVGQSICVDNLFEITNTNVDEVSGDYRVSKLTIKNLQSNKSRNIVHCQFLSWPDHGVPKTAMQILEFIELVRQHQRATLAELNNETGDETMRWSGHPLGPPICVHCSAGIGRTGTFLAIDICVNKLKDNKKLNIEDCVNKIRLQRAQSVQMRDQYVFCYMAILEFAKRDKLLANLNVDVEKLFENFF